MKMKMKTKIKIKMIGMSFWNDVSKKKACRRQDSNPHLLSAEGMLTYYTTSTFSGANDRNVKEMRRKRLGRLNVF